MSDDTTPQPDQVFGAPHPREAARLFGQERAEAAFLSAAASGRLHHAWLLTGPRGVGKATLAWRIARHLLTMTDAEADAPGLFGDAVQAPQAPRTLDVPADHPVARRMLALSEPRVHLMRRGGVGTSESERRKAFLEGRFSRDIRVDEVRELSKFVGLSAADGGWRAVIVDCADELNSAAANALLKMLEEPPARTVLLLVSHQPSRLLPTIRSRCRVLQLAPLGEADLAAALAQAGVDPGSATGAISELSGGSVGEAVRLITLGGMELYSELVAVAASLPRLDRPRALALASAASARGAEDRLDLLFALTDLLLARLARTGATGAAPPEAVPGEAETLLRLSPGPREARAWAELAQQIGARARHGRAVNLDPAALVLDTVFKLQSCAAA